MLQTILERVAGELRRGRNSSMSGATKTRDERRIGWSYTVPPSPHAGHTVTVEKRDAVDKHQAFWLLCSCGSRSLIGEYWLDRLISGEDKPSYQVR